MENNKIVHTHEDVTAALNRAADEIQAVVGDEDPVADAANLMVNLAAGFLEDPKRSAEDVIADSYELDADGSGPLDWIRG